jgi:hypothetical protein
MVAGNAVIVSEAEAAELPGERLATYRRLNDYTLPEAEVWDAHWTAGEASSVPQPPWASRLPSGSPLTVFDTLDYRRDTDVSPGPSPHSHC